jgi:hypothetical protein
MKARLFIIGVLFFSALFANFSGPARAQGLVADLSRHEVNITTGFGGRYCRCPGPEQANGGPA